MSPGRGRGRVGTETVSQASGKTVQGVGRGEGYAEKGGEKIPRVGARRGGDFKERPRAAPLGDDIT